MSGYLDSNQEQPVSKTGRLPIDVHPDLHNIFFFPYFLKKKGTISLFLNP